MRTTRVRDSLETWRSFEQAMQRCWMDFEHDLSPATRVFLDPTTKALGYSVEYLLRNTYPSNVEEDFELEGNLILETNTLNSQGEWLIMSISFPEEHFEQYLRS